MVIGVDANLREVLKIRLVLKKFARDGFPCPALRDAISSLFRNSGEIWFKMPVHLL